MVTTQPISKGQEIFNTYGQMANWQLLHMYGFAEPYPGNTNDTADIQMVTVRKAALQREWERMEQGLLLLSSDVMKGDEAVPWHLKCWGYATAFCFLFPLLP